MTIEVVNCSFVFADKPDADQMAVAEAIGEALSRTYPGVERIEDKCFEVRGSIERGFTIREMVEN